MAIRAVQARGPARLGVIGLGAGVLSAYGRAGDTLRIYEINPLVERLALKQFSFFSSTRASKCILRGDARLTLEAEPAQDYDLIAVDAFSGDSIPVHLLTREAFRTYIRHLKAGGILAVHISNRYLDLEPVCGAAASFFHEAALVVRDKGGSYRDPRGAASAWVLCTRTPALFGQAPFAGMDAHVPVVPAAFRPWTDDYSNLLQVLRIRGR